MEFVRTVRLFGIWLRRCRACPNPGPPGPRDFSQAEAASGLAVRQNLRGIGEPITTETWDMAVTWPYTWPRHAQESNGCGVFALVPIVSLS